MTLERSSHGAATRKKIVILGSTGSIGTSALEVVRAFPERFEVVALAAGNNLPLLAQQSAEFKPRFVAIADQDKLSELRSLCSGCGPIEFSAGPQAVADLGALSGVDAVLAAIAGMSGLRSVLAAAQAGNRIALANKESLVCAGALVERLAAASGASLVPVDSEHSALFQVLKGERASQVERLILTASGGPFLDHAIDDLRSITPEQAIRHPRWSMGAKVSIDSATLVNKALELIEAHWLFKFSPERIAVLIHPQSIVHSLVEFVDGSQLAQLSVPDMKGPIAYALEYPDGRLPSVMKRIDLGEVGSLEFRPFDGGRFPAIGLARRALAEGGAMPAVFTMADEAAVEAFRRRDLSFDQIVPLLDAAMNEFRGSTYSSYDDLTRLEGDVREWCRKGGVARCA